MGKGKKGRKGEREKGRGGDIIACDSGRFLFKACETVESFIIKWREVQLVNTKFSHDWSASGTIASAGNTDI
jgi:hypothetical protein